MVQVIYQPPLLQADWSVCYNHGTNHIHTYHTRSLTLVPRTDMKTSVKSIPVCIVGDVMWDRIIESSAKELD